MKKIISLVVLAILLVASYSFLEGLYLDDYYYFGAGAILVFVFNLMENLRDGR